MLNFLLTGQLNPISFLLLSALLIIAISIHEASHGFIAYKLGDNTAKHMGRLTLNPLAHLDPLGTALLLIAGFGWGKPVPINPFNFNNVRRDSALVAFAGPLSNLLMALLAALVLAIISSLGLPYSLAALIRIFIYFNLILGFFNLIPLGPLDGFKIVAGLLPAHLSAQWEQNESMSLILLIIILFLPIRGVPVISLILNPVLNFMLRLLTGGSGF